MTKSTGPLEKMDLKKQYKNLYSPSDKSVEIVDVPQFNFAMIDGGIETGMSPDTSPQFAGAIGALYGISFTLKFMLKQRKVSPIDYPVMPLEGLWWTASGVFDMRAKDEWQYTLMIMQPNFISQEMYEEALRKLIEKRGSPALSELRYEAYHEGLSMQIMHVGPYEQEPQTIERMAAFAREHGYVTRGKHHEIYLGDPRRARPEKLRTILRQPIER